MLKAPTIHQEDMTDADIRQAQEVARRHGDTMLRRQGTAETVNGSLPDGRHIEISYHHGGSYWFAETTTYFTKAERTALPNRDHARCVKDHKHHKLPRVIRGLPATTQGLPAAIQETAKWLGVPLSPQIEAYCYSGTKTLEIWPHVASDIYVTSATYEPGSDTIRHEPSNVCLITFRDDTGAPIPHIIPDEHGAKQYSHDTANHKYAIAIAKAIGPYNSNPKAHGQGDERKEWLAWLVGQYIRNMDGEQPIHTHSIRR